MMKTEIKKLAAATLLLTLTACSTSSQQDPGKAAPTDPSPLFAGQPKQEQTGRYPAYELHEGERRWGYVDTAGNFAISPQFNTVEEFGPDGLALVYKEGKAGLIDRSGALVLSPAASFITASADGVRLAYYGEMVRAVDAAGVVLFESSELSSSFGSGLAPFRRDNRYGYFDKTGAVAIESQFSYANTFVDGHAVVHLPDGGFALIDTAGTIRRQLDYDHVAQLSEGVVAYRNGQSWGYTSLAGDVEIPARFVEALPFTNGLAIVNAGERYSVPRYGVIDRQGAFVIPPQYGRIQDLGHGRFAVAEPREDGVSAHFTPHAIFTAEGEQLTAFRYYDLLATPLGLSVSDEAETYFLDREGQRAPDLPSAQGIGTMRAVGDLIAMQIDGRLSYVTRDGKTVWQPPDSWPLGGGGAVVERKHRDGRNLLIYYPELKGLPNATVQAAINRGLADLFLGPDWGLGGDVEESVSVGYSIQQVGNVLVVMRNGSIYPLGAAHGQPLADYFHIDLTTGAEYQLSDIFRAESGYVDWLRELVRRQIELDSKGVYDPNPVVRPDHPFAARLDHLLLYWDVYEIAPYAAGFPSFSIPYDEVRDLINTEGDFWKALGLPGI